MCTYNKPYIIIGQTSADVMYLKLKSVYINQFTRAHDLNELEVKFKAISSSQSYFMPLNFKEMLVHGNLMCIKYLLNVVRTGVSRWH